MKNILVLGVNGFIGTHLAQILMKQNYNIIGYDRNLSEPNLYKSIVGDFSKENNFEYILTEHKIDTVYHLICTSAPNESTEIIESEILQDVLPTLRLLEALQKVGIKNLIFASSGGTVYGDSGEQLHHIDDPLTPICSYGVQKVIIEQYIKFYNKKYDMKCKIARISNPYGVLQQKGRTQGIIPLFFEKLKHGQEITIYGETVRDYIYIYDLCQALMTYGEYVGDQSVLNIGTGKGTGLHELVKLLEIVSGKKFIKVNQHVLRNCDVRSNILDINKTVEVLGWKPETALVNGLELIWKQMNSLSSSDTK